MTSVIAPHYRIAVIGAGAMGRGIAMVAAKAGDHVVVADITEDAVNNGRRAVTAELSALQSRNKLTEAESAAILSRITWTTDESHLAGSDLAIEAIIEQFDVKQALFQRLESILSPDSIIATNTSSLAVTALAQGLTSKGRFAGMHFFNPAPQMKLVEIIAGAATAPATLDVLKGRATAWNKTPVQVRDVPGFIVNRVARPYYAEGLRAWAEGVAPPQAIDHVLRVNGGFRMGPLELADLIGQDINFAVAQSIHAAYFGQTRFAPQLAQSTLLAAGRLGRKTGRGIFDYAQALPVTEFIPCPPQAGSVTPTLSGDAGWCCEIDGVHIQVTDGRSATRVAHDLGRPVALIDWSRDFDQAASLACAVSDQAGSRALEAVARLADALGKQAVMLADRPGLLVLRTLSQLANAAADGVRDRIATPAEIDLALVNGANHPVGPLRTADQIGVGRVVTALANIADETGESFYRPSEVLLRAAWASRTLVPEARPDA